MTIDPAAQGSTAVLDEEEEKLAPVWYLLLHNDDVTPMNYVSAVLEQIMKKCESEAHKIMMEAHETGHARCFDGNRERCEMALEQVTQMNSMFAMHLKVTLENEEA